MKTFAFALCLICTALFASPTHAVPTAESLAPLLSKASPAAASASASTTKATVVVFLSAQCPCSASHEPVLKALAEKYEGRGFRFLGVHSNLDEDAARSEKHFTEASLPFPVLQDPDARWANTLGALKTPHVFLISAKGEILFQGGVDDSHIAQVSKKHFLAEALEAVEQGKLPPVKQARALGCVIARKL